jgi:hypothetical protein
MRPLALLLLLPLVAVAQPPDFPAPKTFPPDDATLKAIKDKTAELKKVIATGKVTDADVLVYLKAAEWIVKHGEWYTDKSAAQTVAVLDAGLERAKNAEKKPWLDVRGKAIIRGYKSEVDGSIQPFSVRFPDDFDPKKKYRLDVVLHGRDATLTEVKFIHAKETAKKGKPLDHFEVEVYGRGNNAYRWAGETDVFEAYSEAMSTPVSGGVEVGETINGMVLRGFSMGGAGTWHIGLRHPFAFDVLGPGAGFTTTREYIGEKKFGKQPDYIEKCLHIYDAVDYAENVFNVPVVAYSGEKDKQKLAADLIEAKLKTFKEPHSFTHVIAPGLEHSQPADWQAKLDAEYRRLLDGKKPGPRERVRFVTYTTPKLGGLNNTNFLNLGWVGVTALSKEYERAVVDARIKDGAATATTENVRAVAFDPKVVKKLSLDGQEFELAVVDPRSGELPEPKLFVRENDKWRRMHNSTWHRDTVAKKMYLTGPIDDAFASKFLVVRSTGKPWHKEAEQFTDATRSQFEGAWDRHFRGTVRHDDPKDFSEWPLEDGGKRPKYLGNTFFNRVLFGDPGSNVEIAGLLPHLPIKWTKDELVVNGKKYDPATHVPVLIYPNPFYRESYVVLNSGHTFREADLKGTNALLYPRLGDWAVLKPKPTKDDPAGFEVIDAGLFDENWQFPKKK